MKHERYFKDFLDNTVNLNQSRIDDLNDRVDAVTNFLKTNLDGYRKYSQQGSYAHRTIIKPVQNNDEFDADILVFIKNDDPNIDSFVDYVSRVYDILQNNGNYKDKVKKRTRCVTIDYSEDFHLDIVPCVEYKNDCYICNRDDNCYEETDGDGYKKWLAEKNTIVGGNNLIKVIRILKYLRDHKDNFSIKSILLTTILGNQVNPIDNSFPDLPTILNTLSNRMNDFLQRNESMPIVQNPVLLKENFNRHWDERKYANFRKKFFSYNEKINIAFNKKDHNESVKAWRKLFGDDFGELKESSGKNLKSATSVAGLTGVSTAVPATKPYASYD